MPRRRTRPQLAFRLAVAAPAAALLAAACGGVDTVPYDDAAAVDASPSMEDATQADTSMEDGNQRDATGEGSINDASVSDVSRAGDAADASDASAASDAGDASAASDGRDASDAGDASAPSDASDASDARIASDANDANNPTDAVIVVDASDASDANDSGDAALALDATDAADSSDARLSRDLRLGSAARFAVFAGSTVTNAFGTLTTITGDVGTYPSTTAIGVTPPVVIGAFHLGDLVAAAAAGDIVTAYNGLTPASMPGCTSLTGQDLGGKTLAPGIYCFSTSAQLTGALVLDAANNPNAEWFFQIGSTLTTGPLGAAPARVTVINGGNACNVFWQVGSSATLGTGTVFSGNILALASITFVTNTTLVGRALAESGGVSMDTNTVSIAGCP